MTYGLPTNYVTGNAPESRVANRLHAIANTQLAGALGYYGPGVLSRKYGASSFQATAGTGLQVLVAPGAGYIAGTTLPSAYIERAAPITIPVPPNATSYIYQVLENVFDGNGETINRTEESGLPLTLASPNPVEPNSIPLATVTTNATGVTSITDLHFTYNDPGNAQSVLLKPTGVAAGTYTGATVTVDAKGRITAIVASAGLEQATYTASFTASGAEDRYDLDNPNGATVTLATPTAAMWKKARTTIANVGDAGTWTVQIEAGGTFPGGQATISLPPGNSLETYVAQRADGTTYRWTKI